MRADSRCTMFLCANALWGAYKYAYLSLYSFLSSEAIESRGGGRNQRVKEVSQKTRCGGDVSRCDVTPHRICADMAAKTRMPHAGTMETHRTRGYAASQVLLRT